MGHWLRADLQPPGGGRGHRSGHLLVPDRLSGADRSGEAPSGVALFCILSYRAFLPPLGLFVLLSIILKSR